MLYKLEIENFYCIRQQQVIDLRIAGNVPDEPERFDPIFPGSIERAPRIIALFGANASGKSTVLKALAFLLWFARDSFQLAPDATLPCERFNSAEAQLEPISLAIEFGGPNTPRPSFEPVQTPMATWRYTFRSSLRDGRNIVAAETLHQRPNGRGKWQRVFERQGHEIRAGKVFGLTGFGKITDKVRDNASVISTLAQFDHDLSKWFRNEPGRAISNIMLDRNEPSAELAIKFFVDNDLALAALNSEIQRIDLGIQKMEVRQGPNGLAPYFVHEGLQQPMPWQLESQGTRTFIRYYPLFYIALSSGGMALVDEIDLSIHPLLLPEIVHWFRDPGRNPFMAQLWLTLHSTPLLEELAKEEIFFCEKDDRGQTSIYGLRDIQNVKRGDNHYRKYLSGIYGAVPEIG